ncbi:MAG: SAP domain-containing protein [Deltaproteobacteria bacterium]|nr:SAP domain-containing protein [Deltaproteobacteria bacterium]
MKLNEIKKISKGMGIKAGKLRKADLIRKIQETEGNFMCFQTAGDYCDQENCCWRSDCLK